MTSPQSERIARLNKAMSPQFPQEECQHLAKALSLACETESITYDEIDVPEGWKDDILLVAYEERLLLPMKSRRGSAWEDRVQIFSDGEVYNVPRVVRGIVSRAEATASWDTEYAVAQALQEAGEDRTEEIVHLLNTLMETASDCRIDVERMQTAALGLDIDMHDTLDRFVRCGIMSACTQGSLRTGLPEYEINRCLYWKTPSSTLGEVVSTAKSTHSNSEQ